ncbi:MAG TPA: hypothetical protein VGW40_03460 [Allosphingosinicella sp.]|nr:hypothetical protein [Allosphingosinicella sp.]
MKENFISEKAGGLERMEQKINMGRIFAPEQTALSQDHGLPIVTGIQKHQQHKFKTAAYEV